MKIKYLLGLAPLAVMATQSALAVDVTFKGFIKGSVVTADQSVGSYGSKTMAAITEASRDDNTTNGSNNFLKERKTSIQSQQSRFALVLNQGNATGVFEFDLMDESFKSSPIQKSVPRVRKAEVNYRLNEHITLFGGQRWSTFSGVDPHAYNFIGAQWKAGRVGFLQQELGFDYKTNDYSITVALQNAGQSNASYTSSNTFASTNGSIGTTELSSPALAAKFNWNFIANQRLGFAVQAAKIRYSRGDFAQAQNAHYGDKNETGALAYYEGTFVDDKLNIRGEYYLGQNLNDLNNNTLSNSIASTTNSTSYTRSMRENGGYVSTQYKINANHKVSGAYGYATISKGSQQFLETNEIRKNATARFNYAYLLGDGVTIFAEWTHYNTNYAIASNTFKSYKAQVFEAGIVYNF